MRRTLPTAAATAALVAAATLLALTGCAGPGGSAGSASSASSAPSPASTAATTAPATAASCAGVFVTVQYGLLGKPDVDACAAASGPITAAAALKDAEVSTAGTQKYGDAVVCRVNGLPSASDPISVPGHSAYTETCQDMPAAFAYWAVWVRQAPNGKWGYAQSGVATQQLKPGQTLGLKFTTGSDTTPPQG